MDDEDFGNGFYGEKMRFGKKWGYYEMIITLSKAQIWGGYTKARNLNVIEALEYLSYEKELDHLRVLAQEEAAKKAKAK